MTTKRKPAVKKTTATKKAEAPKEEKAVAKKKPQADPNQLYKVRVTNRVFHEESGHYMDYVKTNPELTKWKREHKGWKVVYKIGEMYPISTIVEGRKMGNSTRQADEIIQNLFNSGISLIYDHYRGDGTPRAMEGLLNKVIARLRLEHPAHSFEQVVHEGLLYLKRVS